MKQAEADRLYEKYTKLGANVVFLYNPRGQINHVRAVEITGLAGGWTITVSDKELTISRKLTLADAKLENFVGGGPLTLAQAEPAIDLLLSGKGE